MPKVKPRKRINGLRDNAPAGEIRVFYAKKDGTPGRLKEVIPNGR